MYETKVILISLADSACRTNSKKMYRIIAKMANAEGLILPSFEDARTELKEELKEELNESKKED